MENNSFILDNFSPNTTWFSMKTLSAFGFFCLSRFSKPVANRKIYRLIRDNKVSSIIEFGLGDGTRTEKMIQTAKRFMLGDTVRYTGIDLFEGRPEGESPLSLREMHRRLNKSEIKSQLVPGDSQSAVMRIANSHLRTDLILITAQYSLESFDQCWYFFPRMLHAQSVVMIQSEAEGAFHSMSRLDIEKLGEKSKKARAAA